MLKNVVSLYEVLDIKPSIADGEVEYPDETHRNQKGVAVEFRWVIACKSQSCLDSRLTTTAGM